MGGAQGSIPPDFAATLQKCSIEPKFHEELFKFTGGDKCHLKNVEEQHLTNLPPAIARGIVRKLQRVLDKRRIVQAKRAVSVQHITQRLQLYTRDSKFVQTVQQCMGLMKDVRGGMLIAIVDGDHAHDVLSNSHFLDCGNFATILKAHVINIHDRFRTFCTLMTAFSSHTATDRWETKELRALEQQLSLSPMTLHCLDTKVKDGALVLSLQGEILAASTMLEAPVGLYDLVNVSGSPVGTRHAALVNTLEHLGARAIKGVIIARSDDGGVHIGWPSGSNQPPCVWHLDKNPRSNGRSCTMRVSILRLLPLPPRHEASKDAGVQKTWQQWCDEALFLESTAFLLRQNDQNGGCQLRICFIFTEHSKMASRREGTNHSGAIRLQATCSIRTHGSAERGPTICLDFGDDAWQLSPQQDWNEDADIIPSNNCSCDYPKGQFRSKLNGTGWLTQIWMHDMSKWIASCFPDTQRTWYVEVSLSTNPGCKAPETITQAEFEQMTQVLMQTFNIQDSKIWMRRTGAIKVVMRGSDYESVKTRFKQSALEADPVFIDLPRGWGVSPVQVLSATPGPVQWLDIASTDEDVYGLLGEVRSIASATFDIDEHLRDETWEE